MNMNTLRKIAISILASVFAFASANAGELSVTGSVKATYAINSVDGSETDNNTGKGMGLANEFTLSASGELDNGYTWSFNQDIDDATVQDDASLTIGMGGLGSVKWNISDGGIQKNFSSSQSTYGTPVDTGTSGTYVDAADTGGMASIRYTTPSGLPLDTSISVQYAPQTGALANNSSNGQGVADTAYESAMEYAISATPIEGLNVGASYFDPDDPAAAQAEEGGAYYATYDIGSLSFGIGKSFKATSLNTNTTNEAENYDNTMMSVAFNVNDSLSVSYEDIESSKEFETSSSDLDMDVESFQVAYTVAGATFSISTEEYDNFQYTEANKLKETNFAMSIAF
jgi:hypothetical protein